VEREGFSDLGGGFWGSCGIKEMRGGGEGEGTSRNEICCGTINSWLDPVLFRSILESDVSRKLLEVLDSIPAEFLDTESGYGDLVTDLFKLELLEREPLKGLPWLSGGVSDDSEYFGGKYEGGVGEGYG